MNLVSLIEQMQAGILFEDPAGKIVKVNQYFCDLFKVFISPSELIGKESKKIISIICNYLVIDSDEYLSLINLRMKEKKVVKGDEICLNDGRILSRDYVPVKEDNALSGHLWQYYDITETRLREKYYNVQRELGFSLAYVSNLKQALKLVLDVVNKIDVIHAAGIYLLKPGSPLPELIIQSGFSDELLKETKSYKSGTPHYDLMMSGVPFYEDIRDIGFHNEILLKEQFRFIGIVPVKNDGKVIGSINILSRDHNEFGIDVKNALESIVSQIGGAFARIEAQNEILRSRKNFQLLFETIDDFVIVMDTDCKIICSNPAFREKLGYLQEDLQGKSLMEIFPREKESDVAGMTGEMRQGVFNPNNIPFCSKTGTLVPVETRIIAGQWDGKDAFYAISRDQSEKKIAEKELKRSEIKWQYALESSGDGLWEWDIETDTVFFSGQWLKMFGYSAGDLTGTRSEWEKLIHPGDLAEVKRNLDIHFRSELPIYRSVHRVLCKDNSYKWVIERGKIMTWNDAGFPEKMIGTSADISTMKENENSLELALRKERELNELKSRFVSQTSHEFRTPLSTMLIAVESLEAYYNNMTDKQREQKIMRVKNSILYLKGIIEKVLNLSHLECGKMKFEAEKLELNKFLGFVISETVENINCQHNIEFKKSPKPIWINIDKQMIRQVINNLISNSCKYSPLLSTIKINLICKDSYAVINCEDRGIGIAEEEEDKIFEPFYRGTNVGEIRGTGLGLALAMQFVKAHNGTITYVPGAEGGTVFTIRLPLETDLT